MNLTPFLVFLCIFILPITAVADSSITAIPVLDVRPWSVPSNESIRFNLSLSPGWNLGNALDCEDDSITPGVNDMTLDSMWSGMQVSEKTIDTLKQTGFKTIRIPVSWHNHVLDDAYTINPEWMARVKEIVDWSLDRGLNVIINCHHDIGEDWIYPTKEKYEQSRSYLVAIWKQIAATFETYDQHLIFEGLNEPRLKGTSVEWLYSYSDPDCIEATDCINRLNQEFVNTIRASSGNNPTRYLMVPAYAASPYTATFNNFVLPEDTAKDRLMVSVHAYIPTDFAMTGSGTDYFDLEDTDQTSVIDDAFNALYDQYIKRGIPVVIGEFGSTDKHNPRDRVDFTAYYAARAYERGLTCVIWDNALFDGYEEVFGLMDRENGTWIEKDIIDTFLTYCK
ncbi:MAG: glycoside hydrolase family 5 protein [Clostridia bacterium]|nr:glycoside hydrolase family 5 protein [Clostridia bacterium]